MRFTEFTKSLLTFAKDIIGASIVAAIYMFLVFGPFIYFAKTLDNPANFMMDFGILTFTIGMFSFIVYERDEEKFRDFYTSGFLFLFSGALTMNTMFMTPFMQNLDSSDAYTIFPALLERGLSEAVMLLINLIFISSLFLASFSFGAGTLLILQSTYSEGIKNAKEEFHRIIEKWKSLLPL